MAMIGNTLGSEIKTAIDGLSSSDKLDMEKIWQAVVTAIITHIQTNGVVSTVTTCPAGAGTGIGTIA